MQASQLGDYDNSALQAAATATDGETDWSGWERWMRAHLDKSSGSAGDELVSLGVRVGNPSAIRWHQERIFQHPCYG
jgi:hypothetical protein